MERFFKDPKTLHKMRTGPLSACMDLCAQRLCDLGYKRFSGRKRLGCIAHFGRWLNHCGIRLHQITPELVARYLNRQGKLKQGDGAILN
ncbi:MAG: hypothetical protein ABSH01_01585 [Terriglobia bacterium]|jgi:hypothetical protein